MVFKDMARGLWALVAGAVILLTNLLSAGVFAEGEGTGEAWVLMEWDTGQVLLEEGGNTLKSPGSMAKLMTVLLTAEAMERGTLSLQQQLTASLSAHKAKGAVIWLNQGEKITVEELLKAVIIGNANDAAIVLSEAIGGSVEGFVLQMNVRAKELEMEHTHYENPTGEAAVGQTTTPYDTALLCRELVRHGDLKPIFLTYMDMVRGEGAQLVNANTLVRSYEGLLGFKASYADADSGGWGLALGAARKDMTLVAVVLDAKDKDSRFERGKGLLNRGFEGFGLRLPEVPPEAMEPMAVANGVYPEVEVAVMDLKPVIMAKGGGNKLTAEFLREENLEAPIKKNQPLGTVTFFLNGEAVYETTLLAAHEVPRLTWLRSFQRLLKSAID